MTTVIAGPQVTTDLGATTPAGPRSPAGRVRARKHIAGIDGLRAFAALWVVLFHMWAFSGGQTLPVLDFVARSGSVGVSLFLVLSGLCLYLPFAANPSRFEAKKFFSRRVRRLLPAYYVTLVLVILAHLIGGSRLGLPTYSAAGWAEQIATHATFTHQFFPSTFYGLNGAFWSLGLEWELYLTLPLLLWAAVRFGVTRTVCGVVAANVVFSLALFALMSTDLMAGQEVWGNVVLANLFIGRWAEFGLGMLVADRYLRGSLRVDRWLILAGLAAGLAAAAWQDGPFYHVFSGVLFAVLAAVVLAGNNVVTRIFSWRPLVAIGVISYSLYLVHQPILEIIGYLASSNGASPQFAFLIMVALFPMLLGLALLLFVTVERRSLSPKGQQPLPLRQLLWRASESAPTRNGAAAGTPTVAEGGQPDARGLASKIPEGAPA